MKALKFLAVTAISILLSTFFVSSPIKILATTDSVDQENVDISTYEETSIDSSVKVGQSFQPSMNMLTKIYVPLRNAEGSINIVVRDAQTNSAVGATIRSFPTKIGSLEWHAFTFPSPLTLSTNKKYVIRVTGGIGTKWTHGVNNTYSKGNTIFYYPDGTTIDLNFDQGFKTYGYNYVKYASGLNPAIPNTQTETSAGADTGNDTGVSATNPQNGTSTEGVIANLDEKNTNASSIGTGTSSSESLPEGAKLEVDESITAPSLTYVMKNNNIVDMSGKSEITVSTKDSLKILGRAPAGMRVIMYMGQTVLSKKANENGDWNMSLESSVLKDGNYTIEAQTQGESGKGSKIVKFFDLNVKEGIIGKLLSGKAGWLVYSLAGAGVVIIILLGGLCYHSWNRRRRKGSSLNVTNGGTSAKL